MWYDFPKVGEQVMKKKVIETPLGKKMILVSNGDQLIKADFLYDETLPPPYADVPLGEDEVLLEAIQQLEAYFAGQRKAFDLPLLMTGTTFQKKVWHVLQDIPYGKVLTYKEIAEQAGSPKGFRAAGGACRANHFAIIVPCHRVLSTKGAYTGYAGDKTFMKERLLALESKEKRLF